MERRRYGVGKRQGSVLSSWIISGASVGIFWATVILCSLYDCTNLGGVRMFSWSTRIVTLSPAEMTAVGR